MREIKLTLAIGGADMTMSMTEKEYQDIKSSIGIDPLLMSINQMWEALNRHADVKNEPILR
jgi:hypothetical protein